jgi:hypothetical protein
METIRISHTAKCDVVSEFFGNSAATIVRKTTRAKNTVTP